MYYFSKKQDNLSKVITLFFVSIFILLATSTVSAKEKKVGIAVSAVINGSPGIGSEVSETLGAALEAMLRVRVKTGPAAQSMLPESAKSETCLGDTDCLVNAGRALQVDELLMLIIIEGAADLKVEATWVDVKSGKTALRSPITVPKDSTEMAEAFGSSAKGLLPGTEEREITITKDEPLEEESTTQKETPAPVESEQSGRHFSTTTIALMGIGGVAGGIWAGIGFNNNILNEPNDKKNSKLDFYYWGPVTIIPFSVAAYLYFTSDAGSKEEPAISFEASDTQFGISYGGKF